MIEINSYLAETEKDLTYIWRLYRDKMTRAQADNIHCKLTSTKTNISIEYPVGVWCMRDYHVA
ncbi:hypothetical protein [Vibrio fortis]|uniref:hypothetical protein n=1 Tax=Vibrio fortis TaxID=212667 RepID=UPI0038CD9278